jgi:hypothetical protein
LHFLIVILRDSSKVNASMKIGVGCSFIGVGCLGLRNSKQPKAKVQSSNKVWVLIGVGMLAGLSIDRVCLSTHDLPNSCICIIFDNGMNKQWTNQPEWTTNHHHTMGDGWQVVRNQQVSLGIQFPS